MPARKYHAYRKTVFTYHRRLQRNAVDGTDITVWIVNIDHEKEEVGCSWRLPSHHYNYYGDRRFVDKYKHELAIGDNLKWQSKVELDIWINKLIYSSHQIYDSIQTVWFSRGFEDGCIFFETEFLPNGHKDLVQMESGDYWVLLRSGGRVFPRKWVFDVVILDEQYKRVQYSWASVDNELDIEFETGGLDTSVLLSAWVFTYQFQAIVQDPTINAAVFLMKNFTWKVSIKDGRFQSIGMGNLQNQLMLEDSDVIHVFVKDSDNIRLLVLCSNGLEKMYSWFQEEYC
ncbi:hypothetical protein RHGRI_031093 [Rhododendron griersonianum]|uniref:F-box associated domain-containing protein n=1 Tax=Rhododendron griersonianum TaxID=479676 RepID=A0AAV6I6H6_9ERIC|nr:hypothetical protein RHGRI_031093 [Rhododendron griersonianum]